MKRLSVTVAAVTAACLASVSILAHQITYKGTVISVEKATVQVTVVDEKTKKSGAMTFKVDKETKVLRGDKLVPFDQARIVKGEKIAVTIDHDVDDTLAYVIRLDASK